MISIKFVYKTFDSSFYDTVCDFLIELSKDDHNHINWNWARWEWMVFHPEFDNSLADKIGLWFYNNEMVGMTTYDHYFGEAFYAVKKDYEELEEEILEYAITNFSNENGIGIAVNITDSHTIDLLHRYEFVKVKNTENILENIFDGSRFDYKLPKGIEVRNLDIKNDLYKHHKVLWYGFENDGDLPIDEQTMDKQKRMLSASHLNSYLHVVAVNEDGEYVAYCGCWYNSKTDYAYVEPVCTVPQYRKMGIGKALVLEALKRCYSEGAKKAYVISDDPFYKSMGFVQHSCNRAHYSRYLFSH